MRGSDYLAQFTLGSNYLFNGISQTKDNAAVKAQVDYQNEQLFYVGALGTNVDYDNANAEVDVYYGKSITLAKNSSISFGLAHYLYFGESTSSDGNFEEINISWQWGELTATLFYSDSFFNTGARHYVAALGYSTSVGANASLSVGVDKSTSLDNAKFSWTSSKKDYWHGYIELHYQWHSLNFSVGVHDTNNDELAEPTLLVSVTKGLSW